MGRTATTVVDQFDLLYDQRTFNEVFFNAINCERVTFVNCVFRDCVVRLQACRWVSFLHCHFDQCRGSHFIQCDPDTDRVVGLVIKNCAFFGNGNPFYRDSVGGMPVDNGASGDVLSIRNCESFDVIDNLIVGGGEIAITCLHGSSHGRICGNMIDNNDAVPIQIGGRDQKPVDNILVADNHILDSGHNRAGGVVAWPAIWVWNASDVAVIDNQVTAPGPSLRYGVVAQQCQRLTVARNIFPVERPLRIPRVHERTVTELISDVRPSY